MSVYMTLIYILKNWRWEEEDEEEVMGITTNYSARKVRCPRSWVLFMRLVLCARVCARVCVRASSSPPKPCDRKAQKMIIYGIN